MILCSQKYLSSSFPCSTTEIENFYICKRHELYCQYCSKSSTLISSFDYQGGWENDETLDEAACREAIEEAGVKGILDVGLFSLFGRGKTLLFQMLCYQ